MAKKYVVATGLQDGVYIDKIGTYTDPTVAVKLADSHGQGYKVFYNKNEYYRQITPTVKISRANSAVCTAAKEIIDKIAEIIKSGKTWIYSNHGCSGTFNSAVKDNNLKSNCATLANWICRKLGITKANEYFYGKAGSTIQWRNVETQEDVYGKCDVFKVGKSVDECVNQGIIIAGDICCYAKQHTNVYAGGGKWYESGTVYANGSGAEGTKLTKFYGDTVIKDWDISWVIRYKDPKFKNATRQYRVQCGEYRLKDNANKMKAALIDKGFDSKIVKIGSHYIVQTGVFSVLGNATSYANRIIEAGLPCLISGIN